MHVITAWSGVRACWQSVVCCIVRQLLGRAAVVLVVICSDRKRYGIVVVCTGLLDGLA